MRYWILCAAGAALLVPSSLVFSDPTPIATIALPAAGNDNSFGTSVRYASNGLMYVWDGVNVWEENAINSSDFTQINPAATTVGSGSADPGPINFSQNGSTIIVSNGAGGAVGGTNNGEMFTIPTSGGSSNTPVGTVADNFDLVPVPASATITSSATKYFVDAGNSSFTGSMVSVFDSATGSNTNVISNIPGASADLTFDSSNNLYVNVGFGADMGQIREFSLSALDNAYSTGTPLDWTAGTSYNPSSFGNQNWAGMFVDPRGFLFSGGENGVTVFGSDHMGLTYSLGSSEGGTIAYNAFNDTFLYEGFDALGNPFNEVFSAAAFVPEPATLSMGVIGVSVLAMRRRRSVVAVNGNGEVRHG
jgi:hypothetical protein